jgi:ribosomal protein S18 acetylase RimI-like enzyme
MSDPVDTPAGPLTPTRATPADAADVLSIVRAAATWLAARGSDQWAYYLTDGAAQLVAGRIAAHEVYLFAAPHARPVGTLCLQWSDPVYWPESGDDGSAGYVHQLATDPAAPRGVGAPLLAWSAARIRAAGRHRFRLDCLAANVGLCRYYERQGFRRAGTVQPYDALAQRWERDL